MAIDYAKLKALSQQIIECIGDTPEGENPSLPETDTAIDDGGQATPQAFMPGDTGDADEGEKISDSEDATDESSEEKKRKKDSALAMMGSVLASKFSK
jgi:hypothetical protein